MNASRVPFYLYVNVLFPLQSSLGGPSVPYHPRWSPYRDMMPTYNQLAASSLLSQQYNTALGLGDACRPVCPHLKSTFAQTPAAVFAPGSTVPGLHGLPARRAPMVEQAVQTVPSVSAGQRRGNALTRPQSKQPVCPSQRPRWDGSQVQKENVPTSKPTWAWPNQPLLVVFLFKPSIQLKKINK